MSENDLKSSIQNLDYDNIKFLILQGHINVDSNELINNNDPLIILLKMYRKPQQHKRVASILKYLINAGFNIHGADSDGNTPIHYAMQNGFLSAIVILLKHKANLANKNKYGFTPIMTALEIKKTPIKELLIPEEFIDNDTLDKNAKNKDLIKLGNKINDFIDFNAFPLIFNNQDIFKQFLSRTIQQYYSIEDNTDKIKNDVKNNINYLLEKKGIDITNDDSFQIISDMMKKILDQFKPNLKNIDFDFIKNPEKLYDFFINKIDPMNIQSGGAATQNNIVQQFDQQLNSNITNYNQMLEYIFKELEILTYKYLLTPDDDNYALQQQYYDNTLANFVLVLPRTQAEQNLHDLFKFFDNIYKQPAQQNNILQENGFINLHNNENEIAFSRYTNEFIININKNNFIKPTIPNLKNTDGMDIAPPVAINNYIKNPVNENINLQNDNYYSFDINVDALDTISSGLFNVNSESTQIQKNITRNLDSRYLLDNVNPPIPVPTGKGGGPPTRGYTNFKEEAFTLGVIVDPFTNNGGNAKPTRHFFFFDAEGRITNMPGLNTFGLPDVRNIIKDLYKYLNLTNNQDIETVGIPAKILRETRYSGPQEFNIAEQGLIPGPNNLVDRPMGVVFDPSTYIGDYASLFIQQVFGWGVFVIAPQFQNAANVVTAGGFHGGVFHPRNWDNVNNDLWDLFITASPGGVPPTYLANETDFNKAVAFYYYTAFHNNTNPLTAQEQANRLFAYNIVIEELKKQTKSYGTMEDIGLAYDISYYEFQKGTTQGNRRQQGGAKNRTNQNSKYYIRLKNDKQIDVPDLVDRSRLIRVKSYDENEDGININDNNDINSYSVTEMNPGIEPPQSIINRRPGLGFGPFNDFPAQIFKERDGTPTREFGSLARDDPTKFMDIFNNGIQISDQNYARSNRSLYVQKNSFPVRIDHRPIGTPVIPYIDKIRIFVRTTSTTNIGQYLNFLSTDNINKIFSPEYYYQNYLRNVIGKIEQFGGARNIRQNRPDSRNTNYLTQIMNLIISKYNQFNESLKDNQISIIEILGEINLFNIFINYYVVKSLEELNKSIKRNSLNFNLQYFNRVFQEKYNNRYNQENGNIQKLSDIIDNVKNQIGTIVNNFNDIFIKNFKTINTYRSLEHTLQDSKINEDVVAINNPGNNVNRSARLVTTEDKQKYTVTDFINMNGIKFITQEFKNREEQKQEGGANMTEGDYNTKKAARNIQSIRRDVVAQLNTRNAQFADDNAKNQVLTDITNNRQRDSNFSRCYQMFQFDLFYVEKYLEYYSKDTDILNKIQHRIRIDGIKYNRPGATIVPTLDEIIPSLLNGDDWRNIFNYTDYGFTPAQVNAASVAYQLPGLYNESQRWLNAANSLGVNQRYAGSIITYYAVIELNEVNVTDPNLAYQAVFDIEAAYNRIPYSHKYNFSNCFTFYNGQNLHNTKYYNFKIKEYIRPPTPYSVGIPAQDDRYIEELRYFNNVENAKDPRIIDSESDSISNNGAKINFANNTAKTVKQNVAKRIDTERVNEIGNQSRAILRKTVDRDKDPVIEANRAANQIQNMVKARADRAKIRQMRVERDRIRREGDLKDKLIADKAIKIRDMIIKKAKKEGNIIKQEGGTRIVAIGEPLLNNVDRGLVIDNYDLGANALPFDIMQTVYYRYLPHNENFLLLDGEFYNFSDGSEEKSTINVMLMVYLYYKYRLQDTQLIGDDLNDTFSGLELVSENIREEWIFEKIRDNYGLILEEKYTNSILEYVRDTLLVNGSIISNRTQIGQTQIGRLRRYLDSNLDMLKSMIRNPIRELISNNQIADIKDIRFLNDISNYNLLISYVGETLKTKHEEKSVPNEDGFDLFLEKVIVKEDYDNTDQELVSDKYMYNFEMVKICNNLALWNQKNKLNNTLYSNLLLTNQFIKIKLAGGQPFIQYRNSKLMNNIMYRFLELMTNNLNNYSNSGYDMFYDFINKETKDMFKEDNSRKNNYPIFGDNFLGCFLMLWDHSIFKLFKKKIDNVDNNDYSNLQIKMMYLLPIRKEYYLDDLLKILTDSCITSIPNILVSPIKDTDYDMMYSNKEYIKLMEIDMNESQIAQESIWENQGAMPLISDQSDYDYLDIAKDELQNKITLKANDRTQVKKNINFAKASFIYNDNNIENRNAIRPQISVYRIKRLFTNVFNDNTIAFLSTIKKYLKDKKEKECINFLYVIYKSQHNILRRFMKGMTGNNIHNLFYQYKDVFEILEKLLKNYIEIFPFSLDIQNRVTPFVNYLKKNKALKLFVDTLAFVVDKYLGNNLYRLLVRLYAKEFHIKYMNRGPESIDANINMDDIDDEDKPKTPELNIPAPQEQKDLLDQIILELDKKIKPYLTKGKFSKLIIKLVLNIRDDKFSKLEFETLDEIFEDLIEDKLKNLPISGKLPDILTGFKTTGKMYYKSIYDKFIKNAYSVLINYNRFLLNQYKYIRTIKEMNDITERSR